MLGTEVAGDKIVNDRRRRAIPKIQDLYSIECLANLVSYPFPRTRTNAMCAGNRAAGSALSAFSNLESVKVVKSADPGVI